jgi:hypothetical protein
MARAMKVRTALHSQKDEMCLCIFGGLQNEVTVPCVQAGKDQGRASRRSSYAGSESAPALSSDAERGGGGIGRRYRAALSGESTPTSSVRAPACGESVSALSVFRSRSIYVRRSRFSAYVPLGVVAKDGGGHSDRRDATAVGSAAIESAIEYITRAAHS